MRIKDMRIKDMKIKKWDIIIISFFILVSFIPAAVFALTASSAEEGLVAVIQVQGKTFREVRLTGHTGEEQILVQTELGMNLIQVVDGKIGMFEASCPDKVCYDPHFISEQGETIVCLPNKVVIEVKGSAPETDQNDIITYRGAGNEKYN